MRVLRTAMLAFAMGFVVAPFHAQSFAQQETRPGSRPEADFRAWLKSLEVNGAKVSEGDTKYDTEHNLLTVSNIVVAGAPLNGTPSGEALRIDKVSLVAFAAGGDGYRFDSAVVEGLTLNTGAQATVAFKLSHLELGSSFFPTLAAFSFDAQRPFSSQIKFLDLLLKASIKQVNASDLIAGSGWRVSKFGATDISNGNIGSVDIADMSATTEGTNIEGGKQSNSEFAASQISLSNINIASFVRLFEESAYLSAGAAKPWSNMVGSMVVNNLSLKNGGGSFSLARADFGSLRVRQFPKNITSIFDSLGRDPTYLKNNPSDAELMSSYIRQSFAFERVQLSDTHVTVPVAEGNADLAVASAVVSGLSATHVDSLEFNRATISDPTGKISMSGLRLSDVNVVSTKVPSQSEANPAVQPITAAMPTVSGVQADGLEVRVGDMVFEFDSLDIAMSYFIGITPTNVKAKLGHVKFPVRQINNAGLRQTLGDLGYTNLDLSLELSMAWQDSVSALAFDQIKVVGADMGTLSASGSLTGVTRRGMENPATALSDELSASGLQNFRLSFLNDSLFDRFLKQAADANKTTPEQLKKLLSANVPNLLNQISSAAIRNKFIFAMVSFINNPVILEISTSTSDTVPLSKVLSALREPYTLPELLKLDVSANTRKN